MDSWNIMLSVLLGAIGLGYIVYGRSQMRGMPLVSGIALCVFPYFVSNIWLILLIAAVLMVLPRFLDF
ncbi:MAG: hypothetical protein K9M45_03890 [Kiritimatiellales bacterium]|nr:hypothetical protein [Kiritimatiellales bacterium]